LTVPINCSLGVRKNVGVAPREVKRMNLAVSAIAFDAMGAAKAGPIVPRDKIASNMPKVARINYAQYEAATSVLAAECYGSAVLDDEHLRSQFPRVGK
jgi:hypothetical protein